MQSQNQKPFTTEDTEKSKTITQQRAEALVRRIGETCDELERLAEENPELVGRVTRGAEEHKDAYVRLKSRLELADAGPRCRWVRQDGTSCGSPQMKKHIYCFAHRQMMEARALALSLPAQEDANAIQIGIMRIQKALTTNNPVRPHNGSERFTGTFTTVSLEGVTPGEGDRRTKNLTADKRSAAEPQPKEKAVKRFPSVRMM